MLRPRSASTLQRRLIIDTVCAYHAPVRSLLSLVEERASFSDDKKNRSREYFGSLQRPRIIYHSCRTRYTRHAPRMCTSGSTRAALIFLSYARRVLLAGPYRYRTQSLPRRGENERESRARARCY